MNKPFSQASENNKEPILARLREVYAATRGVLEIGSGTGQHAVHFGAGLPHLYWQTSDVTAHHAGINAWRSEANLPNVGAPLPLDVDVQPWPVGPPELDGVFSANTAHIMHWPSVCNMFAGVAARLSPGCPFVLYGPFAYGGEHTSASNEAFDASLRARDPGMGIRDIDDLKSMARGHGLELAADHPMPANNRLLVWMR